MTLNFSVAWVGVFKQARKGNDRFCRDNVDIIVLIAINSGLGTKGSGQAVIAQKLLARINKRRQIPSRND